MKWSRIGDPLPNTEGCPPKGPGAKVDQSPPRSSRLLQASQLPSRIGSRYTLIEIRVMGPTQLPPKRTVAGTISGSLKPEPAQYCSAVQSRFSPRLLLAYQKLQFPTARAYTTRLLTLRDAMVLEHSHMHTAILTVTAAGRAHVAGWMRWMRCNPHIHYTTTSTLTPRWPQPVRRWILMYLAYQNLFLQHQICRNTTELQTEHYPP